MSQPQRILSRLPVLAHVFVKRRLIKYRNGFGRVVSLYCDDEDKKRNLYSSFYVKVIRSVKLSVQSLKNIHIEQGTSA